MAPDEQHRREPRLGDSLSVPRLRRGLGRAVPPEAGGHGAQEASHLKERLTILCTFCESEQAPDHFTEAAQAACEREWLEAK